MIRPLIFFPKGDLMSIKETLEQIKVLVEGLIAADETPVAEKTYSAKEVNAMIEEITAEYDAKQVVESESETGFKSFVESKMIKEEETPAE